jgi:uncharacterized protein (AIM24 family)
MQSIEAFLENNGQQQDRSEHFQLENDSLLKIDLNGKVWIKLGTMIAYRGSIQFKRQSAFEGGIGKFVKKALTGEGAALAGAEGRGELFVADRNKKISVIEMTSDSIIVNGNDVLAFDESLKYDITMMKKISGMLSGGLFNLRFSGNGFLAITTHGKPLVLRVTPNSPVITDPNATVAWSASLTTEVKTDISIGTFFGRGSGDSLQQVFKGDGFVVVQPNEEVYYDATSGPH